jgi:hypothetical protein
MFASRAGQDAMSRGTPVERPGVKVIGMSIRPLMVPMLG